MTPSTLRLGTATQARGLRKVIAGAGLLKASGTVCAKLAGWLEHHGYVDAQTAGELVSHARRAARDLPQAERLAMLLHDACEFEVDVEEVSDDDRVEEHLQITDVQPGRIWFDGRYRPDPRVSPGVCAGPARLGVGRK